MSKRRARKSQERRRRRRKRKNMERKKMRPEKPERDDGLQELREPVGEPIIETSEHDGTTSVRRRVKDAEGRELITE